ncbi:hypothetical protein L3V86_07515 [Thiotrichales bacterium 19S11-10]|nr:hypothetical protein [Thiotrichales bacterium 19S11-10]
MPGPGESLPKKKKMYAFPYGTMFDHETRKNLCDFGPFIQSAKDLVGEDGVIVCDGPGTFNWHHSVSDIFASLILGGITGEGGSNGMDANATKIFNAAKEQLPEELIICGHSRGAIIALLAAFLLYLCEETRHIKITILAFDPVSGLKKGESCQPGGKMIPPNVKEYHMLIAAYDSSPGFTTVMPVQISEETKVHSYLVKAHHNEIIGTTLSLYFHANLRSNAAIRCRNYAITVLGLDLALEEEQYTHETRKPWRALEKEVHWVAKNQTFTASELESKIPWLEEKHIHNHEELVQKLHGEVCLHDLSNNIYFNEGLVLLIHKQIINIKKEVPQTFYQSGMIINIGLDGNPEYNQGDECIIS